MRRWSPLFLLGFLIAACTGFALWWSVSANAAPACTITFNGTSSSAWGTAANWSPARVPTTTDTVCLNADVTTPTTAVTVSGFNANGNSPTLQNTLKVTTYVAGLSNSLRGPGALSVGSGVSWTLDLYYLDAPVVNAGSLTVGNGSGLVLNTDAASVTNTGSVALGAGILSNGYAAVVTNSAGGTITGSSEITTPVVNNGTIVSTGSAASPLSLRDLTWGSGTATGAVSVDTLRVPSGGATLNASLTVGDVVRVVPGQGTLTVAAGKSVVVTNSLPVPTTNNGSLRLDLYYLDAPVVNAGSLTVGNGSGLVLNTDAASVTNTGSVALGAGILSNGYPAVVTNSAGGTITGSTQISVPVTNNGSIVSTGIAGDSLDLSNATLGATSSLTGTVGSGGIGGFTFGVPVAIKGSLAVNAASGYTIPAGLVVIPVRDDSGLTGTFASIQSDWWIKGYTATTVSLTYHTLTAATPTISGTPKVGDDAHRQPGHDVGA